MHRVGSKVQILGSDTALQLDGEDHVRQLGPGVHGEHAVVLLGHEVVEVDASGML